MQILGSLLFFVGLNLILQVLVTWRSIPALHKLTERSSGTKPFERYREWLWSRRLELTIVGVALFSIGVLLLRSANSA